MDKVQLVTAFWADVVAQRAHNLREYFIPTATINWHNTNEHFTVEEYIVANCEYPGDWRGQVERLEVFGDKAVSVTRVWLADQNTSYHAVSFFGFVGDKIAILDEYWGDDGAPPQWRQDKNIGSFIHTF